MTPEEIKQIREMLGLSQADLARLMGVGNDAVRKWEYGLRWPRKENAMRLIEIRDEAIRQSEPQAAPA